MKIVRRLDENAVCGQNNSCPAVFLTDTEDIAFIGVLASADMADELPEGSGVGPGEALFTVPREVLVSAGWIPPIR